MTRKRWRAGYFAAVIGVGLPAVGYAAAVSTAALRAPAFWVLAGFLITVDVLSAKVPHMRQNTHISPGTAFSFGLVLAVGTGAAMAAIGVGALLGGLLRRKQLYKLAFNAAQLPLSVLASGAAIAALTGVPLLRPHGAEISNLAVIAAGAAAFFVANYLLVSFAVFLFQARPLLPCLRASLGFHSMPMLVMLSFGPVVAVVAQHRLPLIPVLLFPLAALYQGTQAFIEKEHEAAHDPLTGLPHRNVLNEHIEHAITAAREAEGLIAVMIVDLDDFKEVNDTLGHMVGDEVLRGVAARLSSAMRTGDIVARLGGDEFAVLLPQLRTADDATAIATKLRACLDQPIVVDGHQLAVRGSVGIALYPADGDSPEILMSQADRAMYDAKRSRSHVAVTAAVRSPGLPAAM
ncbi:MAG: GGDEF domain-containing protein [Euzebyales bacterium]|nr:GGDEF domain-containing protein [Euzebyales bacterium]